MASTAFTDLDRNKDGLLDSQELEAGPGLIDAFGKNKKLTQAELVERFQGYATSGIRAMTVVLVVRLDGKPLADAEVTLEPERFMSGIVKPASGRSNASGNVTPKMADYDLPGLAPGIYKVSVSKKDGAGKETLPEKYNAKTTLGIEVAPQQKANSTPVFELKSK